jgi:hypothetical protein
MDEFSFDDLTVEALEPRFEFDIPPCGIEWIENEFVGTLLPPAMCCA